MKKFLNIKHKGFAMFYTLLVVSVVLIATAILADTAIGEVVISGDRRDSNMAFYISEAGVECALYHQRESKAFNMRNERREYSCGNGDTFEAGMRNPSWEAEVINEHDSCYYDYTGVIWYGLVDDPDKYQGDRIGPEDYEPFVVWGEEGECTRVFVTVYPEPVSHEGWFVQISCGVTIRSEGSSKCNPDGTPAPGSTQRVRIERSID